MATTVSRCERRNVREHRNPLLTVLCSTAGWATRMLLLVRRHRLEACRPHLGNMSWHHAKRHSPRFSMPGGTGMFIVMIDGGPGWKTRIFYEKYRGTVTPAFSTAQLTLLCCGMPPMS